MTSSIKQEYHLYKQLVFDREKLYNSIDMIASVKPAFKPEIEPQVWLDENKKVADSQKDPFLRSQELASRLVRGSLIVLQSLDTCITGEVPVKRGSGSYEQTMPQFCHLSDSGAKVLVIGSRTIQKRSAFAGLGGAAPTTEWRETYIHEAASMADALEDTYVRKYDLDCAAQYPKVISEATTRTMEAYGASLILIAETYDIRFPRFLPEAHDL
jgi:hypothetical protein